MRIPVACSRFDQDPINSNPLGTDYHILFMIPLLPRIY